MSGVGEEDHGGAQRRLLEWDVPDHGDVSAAKQVWLASGLLLVVALVAVVVGWLALAWTAQRTLVIAVAALAGPAAAELLALATTRGGPRRRRRVALRAVAAVAVLPVFFVTTALASARPTTVELRATIAHLGLPYPAVPGSEQVSGNRLCRPDCITVTRTYRVPAADNDPVPLVMVALASRGWHTDNGLDPRRAAELRKGQVRLTAGSGERLDEVMVQVTSSS